MAKDIDKVPPALAVFGLDQSKKAHGSYFGEAEIERAIKAAHDMGLFALKVITDEVRETAAKLPRGKLFDSGNAFVPFVALPTYQKLLALGEAAGDSFLRPTTLLVERPPKPKSKPAATPKVASKSQPVPPAPFRMPQDWATLEVGCLVLAADLPEDGYYPAIIVAIDEEKKGADREVILQLRDFPDYEQLRRRVKDLGLLHRNAADAADQPSA